MNQFWVRYCTKCVIRMRYLTSITSGIRFMTYKRCNDLLWSTRLIDYTPNSIRKCQLEASVISKVSSYRHRRSRRHVRAYSRAFWTLPPFLREWHPLSDGVTPWRWRYRQANGRAAAVLRAAIDRSKSRLRMRRTLHGEGVEGGAKSGGEGALWEDTRCNEW